MKECWRCQFDMEIIYGRHVCPNCDWSESIPVVAPVPTPEECRERRDLWTQLAAHAAEAMTDSAVAAHPVAQTLRQIYQYAQDESEDWDTRAADK